LKIEAFAEMEKFSWSDPPGQFALPVHRAGNPWIFGGAFVTLVFAILGLTVLTLISLIATFFICAFFRDPDRVIPDTERAIVSPADGKVIAVEPVQGNAFFTEPGLKISIFMNVFNVHVNRIPCEGRVKEIGYHPGKFFSANLDKASLENEHNAVWLETGSGMEICVVQIAGLIARRIICNLQPGDRVSRGQRFGIICFGSRLDVYLPDTVSVDVAVGAQVRAGTSILGRFR
jgi:phosphatidylserine decarboxylase